MQVTQIYERRGWWLLGVGGSGGAVRAPDNGIDATVCVYVCCVPATVWTLIAWRISDVTWQRETGINQSQGQRLRERHRRREQTQKREESEGWRGSERGKKLHFPFAAACCAHRRLWSRGRIGFIKCFFFPIQMEKFCIFLCFSYGLITGRKRVFCADPSDKVSFFFVSSCKERQAKANGESRITYRAA